MPTIRKARAGTKKAKAKAGKPARKRKPYKFGPAARQRFLKALRDFGTVALAAETAGITTTTAYQHRDTDGAFANAWAEAFELFRDGLEMEAIRRARDGWEQPVYQGGTLVGTVLKHSDQLMVTALKANRPDKYRERTETSGKVEVVISDPMAVLCDSVKLMTPEQWEELLHARESATTDESDR